MLPKLGLCCLTSDKTVSYKTITKTRFLSLSLEQQLEKLNSIYSDNVDMFIKAIKYCFNNSIPMYRVTSHLFPFYETEAGISALSNVVSTLKVLEENIKQSKVRVVMHPDQFVVLSSDSSDVINNSINELEHHAHIFDLIGLSQSHFNLLNIHGGKRGNSKTLIETINNLSDNIKSRLTLENDEYCYSTKELCKVSEQTGVPVLFDFHHSLVSNRCGSYTHRIIKEEFDLAKQTWTTPEWITTHISNGEKDILDRKHSDYIEKYPPCMLEAPWLEVESKLKEKSVFRLQALLQNDVE